MLLAAGCSLLRARELYHGFSGDLAISGAPSVLLMRICTAASLLLCLLLSLILSPEKKSYRERYAAGPGSFPLILGAVLLMLAGPADFLLLRRGGGTIPVSRLILMVFAMAAGALCLCSLVEYQNEESERLRGFFSLAPAFFGSYLMVILYRDIAAEPAVETYGYLMVGTAALVIAWYLAAAHGFEQAKPQWSLFCAAAAFMLLAVSVFGDLGAALVYRIVPRDGGMLTYLAAGVIWSFGGVCAYRKL